MYPDTLRKIYDNEFLIPSDEDALTLPELLDTISKEIWSELETRTGITHNDRKPMISSLRRNLQRTYIDLMIDLTRSDYQSTSAYKPIGNLAILKLGELKDKIQKVLDSELGNIDSYTKSHLKDAAIQIEKAMEATYIYKVM